MSDTAKKPVNNGPLPLVSYDDKVMAERVAVYLEKELTLCRDAKLEVIPNPTPEKERHTGKYPPYWAYNDWVVQTKSGHDYWQSFTASIEKIHTAARDFENGYLLAAAEVKRNTDHEWVSSLTKAQINKLRTKPASDDEIAQAIWERCEFVVNNEGRRRWEFPDTVIVQQTLGNRFRTVKNDQIDEIVKKMNRWDWI